MRRPGSHGKLLTAFRNGEVHILMGTQMIAKGLDFPNVTLVGVINADVGLHMPDFRAAERTFQLLSQVAGRAGRGARNGQVLIQTFNPDHAAITLAAKHDYNAFVAGEMAHRREHKYPPYQRLIRIIVRSRNEDEAEAFADQMADALESAKKKRKAVEQSTDGRAHLGTGRSTGVSIERIFPISSAITIGECRHVTPSGGAMSHRYYVCLAMWN